MLKTLRVAGLAWADAVMEGVFFIMQTYLTTVWKLSFTNAAAILNIWGGISKILSFFFLIIADSFFGNFVVLAFSAISTTVGIVLITVATSPVFGKAIAEGRCQEEGEGATCVAPTSKLLFISGMVLIALGRAARSACTSPFAEDETLETIPYHPSRFFKFLIALFFITPIIAISAFPYVKNWYILFGLSAACTAVATLFFLSGIRTYKNVCPNPKGSPIADILRVFVAAIRKRSQPSPKYNTQLHRINGEEFKDFSSTSILGFLHKAAIILPEDDDVIRSANSNKSWKLCSISQVESVKAIIRMPLMWVPFIVLGIVSSAGNTYFVEQASHMNSNIGSWKAPLQLLLIPLTLGKYLIAILSSSVAFEDSEEIERGGMGMAYSILCCIVAAAVERRRVHAVRRHGLMDKPDDSKVPMSALWLWLQGIFLAMVDADSQIGFSAFLMSETPKSMKGYEDCLAEAVSGLGFISSALMVYVVGKISEIGRSKNWFRYTLNRSRLDRYYWVLSVVTSINFFAFVAIVEYYKKKKRNAPEAEDDEIEKHVREFGTDYYGIKKSSALGLVLSQWKRWQDFMKEKAEDTKGRRKTSREYRNNPIPVFLR